MSPRVEPNSRNEDTSDLPLPQLKAELDALRPEREKPQTEVVFILVDHTAEMYRLDRPTILEAVKKSDMLLIESIEQNEANRKLAQEDNNEITQSDLPIETLHKQLDDLLEEGLIDDFSHLLFLDLAGSKIPIELIDVNEDNPIYQQYDEASKNQERMLDSCIRNAASLSRLQQQLVKYAELSARVIMYRDALVQLQVSQVAKSPENKGKTISVILGAFHTSPSVRLKAQEDIKVTRVFPERISENKRNVIFRYTDEIERNIIFERQEANTLALINRALLERSYNYFVNDENTNLEELREAIERLSDEEVVAILGGVESIVDAATENLDDQKKTIKQYLREVVLLQ